MSDRITVQQATALLTLLEFTPLARFHEDLQDAVSQNYADKVNRELLTVIGTLHDIAYQRPNKTSGDHHE